jgi:hypothetical protein
MFMRGGQMNGVDTKWAVGLAIAHKGGVVRCNNEVEMDEGGSLEG